MKSISYAADNSIVRPPFKAPNGCRAWQGMPIAGPAAAAYNRAGQPLSDLTQRDKISPGHRSHRVSVTHQMTVQQNVLRLSTLIANIDE